MTKEEAIKYLQQLYPNGGHCWLDEQRIEAIGMAVKALQEEPKKKCMYSNDNYTNEDRKVLCDGCKEECRFNLQEKSVSEDLGEYINELSKQFPEVSFAKLSRIAVRVAKWQMAQMIKNATDVTVHVDAGGYPYIPQMELYDYNKDEPLAKKGDKYKVILIKED